VLRDKVKETPRKPAVPQGCTHYWVIESANGPTSRGVCKFCGEQREFRNSWYDLYPGKKQLVAVESPSEEDTKEVELPLGEAISELLKN
jgi:hypothetical protein